MPRSMVCAIAMGWGALRHPAGLPYSPGLGPAVISGCWTPPASRKNPLIALGPKNTLTSGRRVVRPSRWQGRCGDASLPARPK